MAGVSLLISSSERECGKISRDGILWLQLQWIVGIAWLTYQPNIVVIGIPPAQSLIITGITYYVIMKVKAKVAPDKFTEGIN